MSNRSPLLNIIFQSLNRITRTVVRDFGEVENLQVSPNSLEKFVSNTKNKISNTLLNDLIKSRPDWEIKFNADNENKKDKYYWIVDTLNGQFNFSHGLPHFAITVSVEYNNEILSTVILDPIRNEIFFAEKGKGSFQNDRRIRVSKRNNLKSCVFLIFEEKAHNFSSSIKNYFDKINIMATQSSSVIRAFGSSALSFAWLASGKVDCLFAHNLNKNQIACGELLIKEAGGYLTNCKYISAYDTTDDFLVGANPILHKELLKRINNID